MMRTLTLLSILLLGCAAAARAADSGTTANKPADAKVAAAAADLYTVGPGNKVDANTMLGWRTWRALACERCHGAAGEGLVGPSLIERMKEITKERFHEQVMKGNIQKGMPPFESSQMMQKNWEHLYAYLMARAAGDLKPGRVYPLDGADAGKEGGS